MPSELDELIEFLSVPRQEVRKMAVDIVHGLTGSEDGIRKLAGKSADVVPPLLYLLQDKEELRVPAGEALVNLSQDTRLAVAMIYVGAVERIMELLAKLTTGRRPLVLLLVNLTQLEEGVQRLLQDDKSEGQLIGIYVMQLVRYFTRATDSLPADDEFDHVASVLVNITQHARGRQLILDPEKSLLRQVLPQVESPNLVRRQGVAGTVRNLCFEATKQLPNLLLASQFLWPALLLPLAGDKAYSEVDRARMPAELAAPLAYERAAEQDPDVRAAAAEALYLIACEEGGRRALWAVNAPRILQVGYEDEENPKVMDAYERLGALLVEESGAQEEGD